MCKSLVDYFAFVPKQMTGFFIKQWMEKKPNGIFIFRNDRAEDREARKHSNSNLKSMDLLISKIQTQFENEMEGRICTCFFLFSFTLHFFRGLYASI